MEQELSSNVQISKANPLENLFIKGANKRLEIRTSVQSGRGIFALQNISPGIFTYDYGKLYLLNLLNFNTFNEYVIIN